MCSDWRFDLNFTVTVLNFYFQTFGAKVYLLFYTKHTKLVSQAHFQRLGLLFFTRKPSLEVAPTTIEIPLVTVTLTFERDVFCSAHARNSHISTFNLKSELLGFVFSFSLFFSFLCRALD